MTIEYLFVGIGYKLYGTSWEWNDLSSLSRVLCIKTWCTFYRAACNADAV